MSPPAVGPLQTNAGSLDQPLHRTRKTRSAALRGRLPPAKVGGFDDPDDLWEPCMPVELWGG
jgi:hypothetical protein